MRTYARRIAVGCMLWIALAVVSTGFAGDDALKERMKSRLPAIAELKTQGKIGENNKGFLEFRGDAVKEDLVKAENADRLTVYERIAKAQKVDAVIVGQRRALQIARKAKPGEWLQAKDGEWYRKAAE